MVDVVADGQRVEDGAIDSGTHVLRCPSSRPFRAHDAGKYLAVYPEDYRIAAVVRQIASVSNQSEVVLTGPPAPLDFEFASVVWGTNDSAALQTIANATGALSFSTHRYVLASPLFMPNRLRVVGRPGAIISSLMPGTGTEVNNPFTTINTEGLQRTLTLTADVTVGGASIVTSSALAKGDLVQLKNLSDSVNHLLYFTVVAVSGTTAFLDRPILFPFVTNDQVLVVSNRPKDIRIEGNGLVIEGSGDTAIQFWGGKDCRAHDYVVDGHFANWATTVDLGSHDVILSDVHVRGTSGIVFSSAEACAVIRADVQLSTGHAYSAWDSIDLRVEDCRGNQAANAGLDISSNGGRIGAIHTRVVGGNFDSNQLGVWADTTARETMFEGVSVRTNLHAGVLAQSRMMIVGCDIGAGTTSDGNGYFWDPVAYALPALLADSGADVEMFGGWLHLQGASGVHGQYGAIANDAGTHVHLSGVRFQVDAATGATVCAAAGDNGSAPGGLIELDGCRLAGAAAGSAFAFGAATHSTCRRSGAGNDFSSAGAQTTGGGTFT